MYFILQKVTHLSLDQLSNVLVFRGNTVLVKAVRGTSAHEGLELLRNATFLLI